MQANLLRSLVVIANQANALRLVEKPNEAIATSLLCNCFAPLRYARNDKLYFYTFGMLPFCWAIATT